MEHATRPRLGWICTGSLIALALVAGLSTTLDENDNLKLGDPVLLLIPVALIITAAYAFGAMERLSWSMGACSVLGSLAGLGYWAAAAARHPGQFAMDGPVELTLSAWSIAAAGAAFGVLGGLVGAAAYAALGCGRWLRDDVWARLRPHH